MIKRIEKIGDKAIKIIIQNFKEARIELIHPERFSLSIMFENVRFDITLFYIIDENRSCTFSFNILMFDIKFKKLFDRSVENAGNRSFIFNESYDLYFDWEKIKDEKNEFLITQNFDSTISIILNQISILSVYKDIDFQTIFNNTVDKVNPINKEEASFYPKNQSFGKWDMYVRKLYYEAVTKSPNYQKILDLAFQTLNVSVVDSIQTNVPYPDHWTAYLHVYYKNLILIDCALKYNNDGT